MLAPPPPSPDDPPGWVAPLPMPGETPRRYRSRVNSDRAQALRAMTMRKMRAKAEREIGTLSRQVSPTGGLPHAGVRDCPHDPLDPTGLAQMAADALREMYRMVMDTGADPAARIAACAQLRQAAGVGKAPPPPKAYHLPMASLLPASDGASEGATDATRGGSASSTKRRGSIGSDVPLSGAEASREGGESGPGQAGSVETAPGSAEAGSSFLGPSSRSDAPPSATGGPTGE